MAALSAVNKSILKSASPEQINTMMARVRSYANRDRWVGKRNRYRRNTVDAIKNDYKAGLLNHRHVGDYIAASAPLHCSDGWAFLGRAISSHLRGDPDTARHLAYYAELRAAIALLATQGIGIFNRQNFVIDRVGTAKQLIGAGGTHVATWDLLEEWSSSAAAADLLGKLLQPAGQPIQQWITALPIGSSWHPIATDWLKRNALDLKLLRDDREARNEASYRPTQLVTRRSLEARKAASFVCDFWTLLEPSKTSTFGTLDRYVLRSTLDTVFKATFGSVRRNSRQFRNALDKAVAANTSAHDPFPWHAFLCRDSDAEDPPVLHLAIKPVKLSSPTHDSEAISRGFLLLRIASGAVRATLLDAGLHVDSLDFWWHGLGEDRGVWDDPPDSSQLTDLWADAEDAIVEVSAWCHHTSVNSYRCLHDDCPRALHTLTRLEMVGLWSIAS